MSFETLIVFGHIKIVLMGLSHTAGSSGASSCGMRMDICGMLPLLYTLLTMATLPAFFIALANE